MTSTASSGDRSPQPDPEGRRRQLASRGAPPVIRIPFPPIDFACGAAHYRTAAIELVAELLPGFRSDGADREAMARTPNARYSLRKDLRVWRLVFDGQEAVLQHERGLWFVAWLLYHPPQSPIHAIDLAAKIPEVYRAQFALTQLTDPATGQTALLESHARLQERSLGLDEAQSLRALQRKARELEATLDDDSESEPIKAEALRELEAIYDFQRHHGRRSQDAGQRVVATVRQSIKRLHGHLVGAVDASGLPHRVLRAFADHLKQFLLAPSVRYAGHGGRYARRGLAGCFTYEPPEGVVWRS